MLQASCHFKWLAGSIVLLVSGVTFFTFLPSTPQADHTGRKEINPRKQRLFQQERGSNVTQVDKVQPDQKDNRKRFSPQQERESSVTQVDKVQPDQKDNRQRFSPKLRKSNYTKNMTLRNNMTPTEYYWFKRRKKKAEWQMYRKDCPPQIARLNMTTWQKPFSQIVAHGSQDRSLRPTRHILTTVCGCRRDIQEQLERFLKSIILTQGTKFSKGNFDWAVWVLIDIYGFHTFTPFLRNLHAKSGSFREQSRITVYLVSNGNLMRQYGDTLTNIPFEPCHSMFLFASEVLPSDVEDVIVFGIDQLIVDDLELHWENAVYMGWDSSKLFAVAEEKITRSILPPDQRWNEGWRWKPHTWQSRRQLNYSMACRSSAGIEEKNSSVEKNNSISKAYPHQFLFHGVATGSHIMSLKNARKYDFVTWVTTLVQRFDLKTFGLGDQHIVNRYGMEYPERMSLLQCNSNVRAICSCDIDLHPPIVLHGSGGRFQMVIRAIVAVYHDQPFWVAFAREVDSFFDIAVARQLTRRLARNQTSIWKAANETIREDLVKTINRGDNLVGAMTPRINFPPIGPHTDTTNSQTWIATYLNLHINVSQMPSMLKQTLGCGKMNMIDSDDPSKK